MGRSSLSTQAALLTSLLTMQDYRTIGGQLTLIEALAQPDAEDVDFDPPRVKGFYRPADSS